METMTVKNWAQCAGILIGGVAWRLAVALLCGTGVLISAIGDAGPVAAGFLCGLMVAQKTGETA